MGVLSATEISAITKYTSSYFRQINDYLRGIEEPNREIVSLVNALDSAVSKSFFFDDIMIYRGVDGSFLSTHFFRNLRLGSMITDDAFVSTSLSIDVAKRYTAQPPGGVIMKIRRTAGTNALLLAEFSDYPEEQEVLLPRSLTMTVMGYDYSQRVLELQVI